MTLDPDVCYRALSSRDPRFDGRFVTAVLTTGIYCRPVCPARTPRRPNVRFYPSAAAAAEAGFRPCRRCRPEAAPGSAAWHGTSASVGRALRLIDAGALDTASVDTLAARLGMGERQLRRLFRRHLGASPVAVAQTRRLQLAARLLVETPLPIGEVAHAAGFSSLRRFHAALRAAYRTTPRALRASGQRGRATPAPDGPGGLVLRLAFRPPLDWPGLLAFLAPRAIPGVEAVAGETYRRSVVADGRPGCIEVSRAARRDALLLRVPTALARGLGSLVVRARRLFDLDADPAAIATHLGRDPDLALRLGRHPGLRLPGAWDGFELAVRAVLGQQVSVQAASTLAGRLVRTWGKPLPTAEGGVGWLFPEPGALAGAGLESAGLPRARAGAVRALAAAVRDGDLDLETPADPEAAAARFGALPGIGPWTAAYVALRALGEPDAFPASDLGLRRALARGGPLPSPRELARRAEAWRPWRGYAAMALWGGA